LLIIGLTTATTLKIIIIIIIIIIIWQAFEADGISVAKESAGLE